MPDKRMFKTMLCVLILIGLSIGANGQWYYKFPSFLKRYEMGYTFPISMATYSTTNKWNDGLHDFDSTFTTNTTSKGLLGVTVGTSFALAKLSDRCMLALGVNLNYNMYLWNYNTPMFIGALTDENGQVLYEFDNSIGFSGASLQFGLPISADFKFGGEAFLRKKSRFSTTLGVGAMPAVAVTADFDNAGFGYGVTPFVKAEIGMYAGIGLKLRAMYGFGYLPFYTTENSLSGWTGYQVESSLIGKQTLNFSLIIMPFAWTWGEKGWWNSY